jgi:predicted transcriptional regulator
MAEFNIKKRVESFNKTIRLPEDIIEKVEKIANENDISFNRVILEMIEFSLDNMKK